MQRPDRSSGRYYLVTSSPNFSSFWLNYSGSLFRVIMKTRRSTVLVSAAAILLLFCLFLPGPSQAQGIDGLSQLLGGFGPSRNSGQPSAPVTVERNAPPYTGMFSGKETSGAETKSLDAKFACYPAHDPAFDQTDTFVCYAAQ
jgi:hypothetical protein